ncbi:MAG: methionine--tRNA ligase [Ignisphaera sp.]|uniref:methionine--tRNA ligase n=1 Tax=Ignisphaera aggregans TaxID=334771 RepID=A0A7C4JJB9_9CREN
MHDGCSIYITTPIYYPNDKPHLGHAYTTILADIVARWYKLMGCETFLLTGTDEHGLKLQREAEKRGLSPKQFVDEMVGIFKEYWRLLNIDYSRFIRTTDKDHEEAVKHVLSKLYDKGYIYKGVYKGWYCAGCEKYYSEKEYEVVEGTPACPIHKKPLEFIDEEAYFLKLSQFEDYMVKMLKDGNVIYPKHYALEVLNKVYAEGLQDLAVSRPRSRVSWGIDLPFDTNYTVYVWIDALLNYLSSLGYPKDLNKLENFWGNAIQFIGKDILWFHTAVWFSLLAMLDLPPPKKLVVHAYLTVKGQKMGKSLGNVISIDDVVERYKNPEVVRFIVARIANYDKDSEVSWEIYDEIYTNDLVNNYGNLVRRVTILAQKLLEGIVEKDIDAEFAKIVAELRSKAVESYSELKIAEAVKYALEISHEANAYLNRKEPWRSSNPRQTIYTSLEAIRITSLLLYPVMPKTIEKLFTMLNIDIGKGLEQLNVGFIDKYVVKESPILFKKIS